MEKNKMIERENMLKQYEKELKIAVETAYSYEPQQVIRSIESCESFNWLDADTYLYIKFYALLLAYIRCGEKLDSALDCSLDCFTDKQQLQLQQLLLGVTCPFQSLKEDIVPALEDDCAENILAPYRRQFESRGGFASVMSYALLCVYLAWGDLARIALFAGAYEGESELCMFLAGSINNALTEYVKAL